MAARGSTKAKAQVSIYVLCIPQAGNSMPRRIGLGLRADPIPSTNSSKAQGCKPGSLDDEQTEIVHEDIMTKPGTSRDKKNND